MSDRFQIEHPETGEQYGLSSLQAFEDDYEPRGFVISDPQPHKWVAPERKSKAKGKKADESHELPASA